MSSGKAKIAIAGGFLIAAALAAFVAMPVLLTRPAIQKKLADQLFVWSNGQLKIDGPVSLRYFPQVTLKAGNASLRRSFSDQQEMRQARLSGGSIEIFVESLEAQIGWWRLLRGDLRANGLRLIRPRINLRLADEKIARSPYDSTKAFVSLLKDSPFSDISISNGNLILPLGENKSSDFNKISADIHLSKSALAGNGTFTWRGEKITFSADASGISKNGQVLKSPVRLSVQTGFMDAAMDGTAVIDRKAQFKGQMDINISQLRRFGRWLGGTLPEGDILTRATASGEVNWFGGKLAFENGKFSLDGNGADGAVTIKYDGIRPLFEGTLAFDRIALTKVDIPPIASSQRDATLADGTGLATLETPATVSSQSRRSTTRALGAGSASPTRPDNTAGNIDLDLFKLIDIDLRISASGIDARLNDKPLVIGNTAFSATNRSGTLVLDIVELSFFGGTVTGSIKAREIKEIPHFVFKGDMRGIDCAPLAEALFGFPALSGLGAGNLHLFASGRSFATLLKSFRGKGAFQIDAGGQVGLDIAQTLVAARRAGGELAKSTGDALSAPTGGAASARHKTMSGWGPGASGSTKFRQLKAAFEFRDGLVKATALNMTSPIHDYLASGILDFTRKTIDVSIHVYPHLDTASAATSSAPAVSQKLPVLDIKGPMDRPTIGLRHDRLPATRTLFSTGTTDLPGKSMPDLPVKQLNQ